MKIRLITIPNLITLGNLACGVTAIWILAGGYNWWAGLEIAFWLMVAAAVCDFADGFAARLLKSVSPVGIQLDSLSDMVSFGVLPTLIAMRTYQLLGGTEWWGFALIALIALCSALRLAKFNVDDTQQTEFTGLPTPACALLIASASLWLVQVQASVWVVVVGAIVLALLLVSPVRMFALKFHGWNWRENRLRYVFLLVALALVIIFGITGIAFAVALYIIVSIIRWIAK